MDHAWQLQDAKNKFSEVITKAIEQGPQEITRRGKKTAVILSFQDYAKLLKGAESLADFFKKSPLTGIDFERNQDMPREVSL